MLEDLKVHGSTAAFTVPGTIRTVPGTGYCATVLYSTVVYVQYCTVQYFTVGSFLFSDRDVQLSTTDFNFFEFKP